MFWWKILVLVLLPVFSVALICVGAWLSAKGRVPERMTNLRRGLDLYLAVWGFSILFAATFVILVDFWYNPFVGVGVAVLLATSGILWFLNSTRYLTDTAKTQDTTDIDYLNIYSKTDMAHAIVLLAASAGALALTTLVVMIQQRYP